MGKAITPDDANAGVSSDIGRFAIVPLWLVKRCNATKNGAAALSVFIALHNWADRDRACFPSVASIAEQAGISTPSAARGIKTLQELGALTVIARYVPGTRERTSSLYRMHHAEPPVDSTYPQIRGDMSHQIRGDMSPQIRESNKSNTEREQTEQENTGTLTHKSTSLPTRREQSETESFDDFWDRYPRKVGKGAAQSRWRRLSTADRSAVLAAVPDHVARWREMRTETQFIPHPATWLSQRRWEDQLATDARREITMPSAVRHAADLLARLEHTDAQRPSSISLRALEQADDEEGWL